VAFNSVYKKIGKMIKQIRNEKGISQETLAMDSHLNRAYVGYIERGERHPSVETIYKISLALKTPLYYFFKFNDEKDKY
jgi:transcriptional regulator with XRE-family HTH domain